jgi:hypothetical protein
MLAARDSWRMAPISNQVTLANSLHEPTYSRAQDTRPRASKLLRHRRQALGVGGTQREIGTRMEAFAKALKRDLPLDGVLRERGRKLGIAEGSRLDRVVQARQIDRALTHAIGIEHGSRVRSGFAAADGRDGRAGLGQWARRAETAAKTH